MDLDAFSGCLLKSKTINATDSVAVPRPLISFIAVE